MDYLGSIGISVVYRDNTISIISKYCDNINPQQILEIM